MPRVTVVEPYPVLWDLDGFDGAVEVIAVDPDTGTGTVRQPDVDPTTGAADWVETETPLDPEFIAKLVPGPRVEPPEVPTNVALGGAVDTKTAMIAAHEQLQQDQASDDPPAVEVDPRP